MERMHEHASEQFLDLAGNEFQMTELTRVQKILLDYHEISHSRYFVIKFSFQNTLSN